MNLEVVLPLVLELKHLYSLFLTVADSGIRYNHRQLTILQQ